MSSKDLQSVLEITDPAMAALLDELVAGYMARRNGITLEQMRARIDTDATTNASYCRKMCRATMVLIRDAGFQMLKKQNTQSLAKPQGVDHTPADPSFDINDLLGGKPTN